MSTDARRASRTRATKETTIDAELVLDGTGRTEVSTGLPFFVHMVEQLGKHAPALCNAAISAPAVHGLQTVSLLLAGSLFWRQVLADVFARPVVTLAAQEGSALGAALLAMVGTGEYANVPDVCGAVIREARRVEPNADDAAVYARGHRVYQSLYPALRPFFGRD